MPHIVASLASHSCAACCLPQTVRGWQAVKARALGQEHDTLALADVLDGRMLQQWRYRATDVKHQGWYWQYSLGSLAIDSVEVSHLHRPPTPLNAAATPPGLAVPALAPLYQLCYCAALTRGL